VSVRSSFIVAVLAAGLLPGSVTAAEPPEPITLRGHTGWVGGVAFSPDGKTLATASADKTVKLWDVATGKETRTLKGHTDYVSSVAFSPDGKTLATGSYDHTAKIWDAESGELKHTLKGHKGVVMSVAFHPEGKELATGSIDGTVRLWDTGKGHVLDALTARKSWVNAVAYDASGQAFASASSDNTVVVSGSVVRQFPILRPKAGEVRSIAFSTQLLAVGTRYGVVKVWNGKVEEIASLKNKHGGDVWGVAFSPDGKVLAAADGDWNKPSDVVLWDTRTWKELARLKHTNEVLCVAFHPTKPVLAAGAWDKTVKLWDLTELLKAK
jgi:WD40 repeat protein